jgi:hypothetical protein
MLGALLAPREVAPTRALKRSDRDGDGLFDDDETEVYGTDPDNSDSDGTDPRTPNGAPAGCAEGQTPCGGSALTS